MNIALAENDTTASLDAIWAAYSRTREEKAEGGRNSSTAPGGLVPSPYYANLSELRGRGAGVGHGYLNARYYNPAQGQFLSQDPVFLGQPNQQNLQDPQSLNAYSYSDDNPITKSDPSGKCLEDGCVIEAAGIGAFAGFVGGIGLQAVSDINSGHLSSVSQYAISGAKGAGIGLSTAAASAAGAGAALVGLVSGGATAITDFAGNLATHQQTSLSSLAQDSVLNGVTGGAFEYLPGVSGRLPDLFSQAFFTGAHAQDALTKEFAGVSATLLYGNVSNSIGSFTGNRNTSSGSQSAVFSSLRSAFSPTNSSQSHALQNVVSAFSNSKN